GPRAPEIAALFSGSMLDARAIGPAPGAASALQGAYAARTKSTEALGVAIRALATHEGVDQALLEEWSISQPALEKKCERAVAVAAPKACRFVGEMREGGAGFEGAGLPTGFHLAAAEICERLACFKDQTEPVLTVAKVVQALRD